MNGGHSSDLLFVCFGYWKSVIISKRAVSYTSMLFTYSNKNTSFTIFPKCILFLQILINKSELFTTGYKIFLCLYGVLGKSEAFNHYTHIKALQ